MLNKLKSLLQNKVKHKNKQYQEAYIENSTDITAQTIIVADDQFKTLVFSKDNITATKSITVKKTASLSIIEGDDQGFKLSIGSSRINIGRRKTNELPLKDINSSRLHAYILFQNSKHVLFDASSLNGTFLNEEKITEVALNHGDIFKIGNTRILYETVCI